MRILRILTLSVTLLSLLLFSGCLKIDQNQSALDPKGPVASQQADAFYVTLYLTTFLWIVVGGAMLYAVWRYRLKKTDDPNEIPEQSHGHPIIEVGLILFSAACLVVVAVPTLQGILMTKSLPEEYQEGAITVDVTGYQWWWAFDYPEEGVTTANELVIPVGKAVKLNLRSADVIHSFWLPKLAGKVDLMPGQENFMWIQADEPGMYWGQCAEFCGDAHAYMLFRARAVPQEEYEAWLADLKDGPEVPVDAPEMPEEYSEQVVQGKKVFMQNCYSCHMVGGKGGVNGPNLTNFGSRATIAAGWMENNTENLFNWIKKPHEIKPGNYMWYGVPMKTPGGGIITMEGLKEADLSDEDIHAVVAYLQTLK
ncbi:cytochrome c oxidase subunit II [Coraliomargarita sinensis]|uniref:cytochrome-c oxidase n=1 Tax=Coraliomargarita sinensis TaxID=2174842 RepID=A0A317ZD41_9BACT|nr:cytochrome c oxidase subunit II [Coraliomargarita sinensis]PXA03155.1 cytochrome c oxidase subunit II [Coraliomargarita sinensis]